MSGIVIISFFLSVHVLIDQQNPCYLVLLPAMHIKLSPTYHMAQKNGLLVRLILGFRLFGHLTVSTKRFKKQSFVHVLIDQQRMVC